MAADRIVRKTDTAGSNDVARDDSARGGDKRDIAAAKPNVANKPLTRSRLADTLLRAHLFASRFQEPPAEQHHAESARDNASYRKGAKRPVKRPGIMSKKV